MKFPAFGSDGEEILGLPWWSLEGWENGSQTIGCTEVLWGSVTTEVLIQQAWNRAQESTLLTRPGVVLMLLVGDYTLRTTWLRKPFHAF